MKNTTTKDGKFLYIDNRAIGGEKIINAIRRQGGMNKLIREIILEDTLSTIELSKEEEKKQVELFKQQNGLEDKERLETFMKEKQLDEKQITLLATRPERVIRFREEKWGPMVNALYLKNKEMYDLITYKRIQCNDPDIMQEVYFRLKDGEETWGDMFKQFRGIKNTSCGVMGPMPVKVVEEPLLSSMRTKGINRVCGPVAIRDQFAIVELVELKPSKLTEEIRSNVLRDEFEIWLKTESEKALSKARYSA